MHNYAGTTVEQDLRFSDKRKKLLKTTKFGEGLERKVDMTKINVDSLKPWIAQRITELLGIEDDVVVEFVYNQLEERHPDAKEMQINLTGFLNGKNARIFLSELWDHLCSAQENVTCIPNEFLEQKKNEIKQRQEEQEWINEIMKKKEEQIKEHLAKERREVEMKLELRSILSEKNDAKTDVKDDATARDSPEKEKERTRDRTPDKKRSDRDKEKDRRRKSRTPEKWYSRRSRTPDRRAPYSRQRSGFGRSHYSPPAVRRRSMSPSRSRSPRRRSPSPRRRSPSPRHRSPPPKRRSPPRRAISPLPRRKSRSPRKSEQIKKKVRSSSEESFISSEDDDGKARGSKAGNEKESVQKRINYRKHDEDDSGKEFIPSYGGSSEDEAPVNGRKQDWKPRKPSPFVRRHRTPEPRRRSPVMRRFSPARRRRNPSPRRRSPPPPPRFSPARRRQSPKPRCGRVSVSPVRQPAHSPVRGRKATPSSSPSPKKRQHSPVSVSPPPVKPRRKPPPKSESEDESFSESEASPKMREMPPKSKGAPKSRSPPKEEIKKTTVESSSSDSDNGEDYPAIRAIEVLRARALILSCIHHLKVSMAE